MMGKDSDRGAPIMYLKCLVLLHAGAHKGPFLKVTLSWVGATYLESKVGALMPAPPPCYAGKEGTSRLGLILGARRLFLLTSINGTEVRLLTYLCVSLAQT